MHPRQQTAIRLASLEEIEVRIEKLVEGGDGFGRYDGIPIFVSRSVPGDRLRVRLSERRPGYARAEIIEILEPGAGRRQAPCPHFDRCGGCDLQQLEEAYQLRYKAESVRETLRRIGGIETPANITVVAGKSWGYRVRAQLHIAESDRGREVGYFSRGSHDLVAASHCPVLVPELERILPELPRHLNEVSHRRIDIAAGDDERWTHSPPVDGLPQGEVTTRVGDLVYSYDARCFFQSHRQMVSSLVEHVLGPASENEVDKDATVYDLFAGVGLFSLPLAQRYGTVVAVESDRIACRFLRRNAKHNRLANVFAEHRSVDTWISRLPRKLTRVVVDPPRQGLSHTVRRVLVTRQPGWLTYVSCNAATLARDLKQLGSGFRLDSLALLDMFPQTGHMEIVAQLRDREAHPDP